MLNNIQNHRGFALVDILTDIQNSLIKEATRQAIRAGVLRDSDQSYEVDSVPDGALELIEDTVDNRSRLPFGGAAGCQPK